MSSYYVYKNLTLKLPFALVSILWYTYTYLDPTTLEIIRISSHDSTYYKRPTDLSERRNTKSFIYTSESIGNHFESLFKRRVFQS